MAVPWYWIELHCERCKAERAGETWHTVEGKAYRVGVTYRPARAPKVCRTCGGPLTLGGDAGESEQGSFW